VRTKESQIDKQIELVRGLYKCKGEDENAEKGRKELKM
jgi:hypothetical protein